MFTMNGTKISLQSLVGGNMPTVILQENGNIKNASIFDALLQIHR